MKKSFLSAAAVALVGLSACGTQQNASTASDSPIRVITVQVCDRGYSIVDRGGVLFVKQSDGRVQRITPETDRKAHTADFDIVWDVNPNGLGGAVLFPKDPSKDSIQCDLRAN